MSNLNNYIRLYKNLMPLNLCDDIINEYNNAGLWSPAKTFWHNSLNKEDVLYGEKYRTCDRIMISSPEICEGVDERIKLDGKIFEVVSKVFQKYSEEFPHCTLSSDSGYSLLRYKSGQFYKVHVDSVHVHRIVSISINLNEDYEGGEISFFEGKSIYSLKKGDILVFPSNFLYPHEVLPVKKGTRYSVITWGT